MPMSSPHMAERRRIRAMMSLVHSPRRFGSEAIGSLMLVTYSEPWLRHLANL